MESRKHQESRAREVVSIRGILAAGLTAGALNFVMSGGGPWTTAGTMNAIMGRDVSMNFFALAMAHFALSLAYAAVIGCRGLGGQMHSPESRAVLTHIIFSLFAAGVYKGASIPKPLPDDEGDASPSASKQ